MQAFFPCHDCHPVDARPFSVGSECVGRRYGRRRCAGGTPMSSGTGDDGGDDGDRWSLHVT